MKNYYWGILSFPFLLLIWFWVGAHFHASYLFPSPLDTWREWGKELSSAEYYNDIGISLYRLIIGFVIASVSAFLVGTLAGVSLTFRQFITPIVTFFQATPPMAWAPLLIIFLDLGNAPMIAVIVIAAFFPIVVSVIQGMQLIKLTHIRAAQSLGANRFQLAWYVYLPEVMPSAFSGIVIGFGVAWRSLVAAEMIGGKSGIGWLIVTGSQIGNAPVVMVGIITIGILALLIEFICLRPIKKRITKWAPRS